MSAARRRSRPLDSIEQECVDREKPLEVEFLLDEQDYCLKWPNAPLSRFLLPAVHGAAAAGNATGTFAAAAAAAAATTHCSQKQQRASKDHAVYSRVIIPAIYAEEDDARLKENNPNNSGDDDDLMSEMDDHNSDMIIMPPPRRWSGNPHELFVFGRRQVQEVKKMHEGFPIRFGLLGHDNMTVASSSSRSSSTLTAALWWDAQLWITEFEHMAYQQCLNKTLPVLRMLDLLSAVPWSTVEELWKENVCSTRSGEGGGIKNEHDAFSNGDADSAQATPPPPSQWLWIGSLTLEGVKALFDMWHSWRRETVSLHRPWGVALIASLHVSLPLDEYFLSQSAAALSSTTGLQGGDAVDGLRRRSLSSQLPDFGLRVKRSRRGESVAQSVFQYLPIDPTTSQVWTQQQSAWGLHACGRRGMTAHEIESFVDGLPDPHDVKLKSLDEAEAKRRQDLLNSMWESELQDCRRLLMLS